jgi:hypothetical protein
VRYELYRRGANEPGTMQPITLNLLLDLGKELTEAELVLSNKPADQLAAQANQWLLAWETEQITEAQFRGAHVSTTALMQARSTRLAAETKLLEMLAEEKRSEPLLILPLVFDSEENKLYEAKNQAKMQFEMSQAKPHDLALARRDALKVPLQIRWELYRIGAMEPGGRPVTLDLVRESEARLLEAEADISNKTADRLAAYEKDWEWKYLAEKMTQRGYEMGGASRTALERARFDRLGAEIRLLEARAKRNKK